MDIILLNPKFQTNPRPHRGLLHKSTSCMHPVVDVVAAVSRSLVAGGEDGRTLYLR